MVCSAQCEQLMKSHLNGDSELVSDTNGLTDLDITI
jgi:hypothetical protein